MAGRTVSVVLFITAMTVIIQAAETECRGPMTKQGDRQSPCKAFMDDLTVLTPDGSCKAWTRCVHGQDCVSNRRRLDFSS